MFANQSCLEKHLRKIFTVEYLPYFNTSKKQLIPAKRNVKN